MPVPSKLAAGVQSCFDGLRGERSLRDPKLSADLSRDPAGLGEELRCRDRDRDRDRERDFRRPGNLERALWGLKLRLLRLS